MQKKIDTKIQWHPAFYSAIKLELIENKQDLIYETEHQLNKKPIQIDYLIIKKGCSINVKNEIGKIFRKFNIMEYKSPEDSMSIDTYFKALGYACLYKSYGENVDSIITKAKKYAQNEPNHDIDSVLTVVIEANKNTFEKLRRNLTMYEALRELMKDQLEAEMQECRKNSIAEGKAEGIAQGKANGIAQGKEEIISNMLKKTSPEQISYLCSLPLDFVLNIKNKNQ